MKRETMEKDKKPEDQNISDKTIKLSDEAVKALCKEGASVILIVCGTDTFINNCNCRDVRGASEMVTYLELAKKRLMESIIQYQNKRELKPTIIPDEDSYIG